MLNVISKHQSYTFKAVLIEQNSSLSAGNCSLQVKSRRISKFNQISYYVWENTFWSIHMFYRYIEVAIPHSWVGNRLISTKESALLTTLSQQVTKEHILFSNMQKVGFETLA